MNITTDPLRDKKKLQDVYNYLRGQELRNYVMAKVQLNTALRISDIVPLKVKDVLHSGGYFREYITLHEKKTGKEKHIAINDMLKRTLKSYIKERHLGYEDYLFPSRKHKDGCVSHISTTQAHRIFQEAGKALKLENFNSHSLRKTWGYNAYKETKNIALIMQVYNHSSAEQTLRYIGITQRDKDSLYNKIQL